MENFIQHRLTVQAQDESPNTPVVGSLCSKPIHTPLSEALLNNTNTPGFCVNTNHPRLRTRVVSSILRLSFLKSCRSLKRPPHSFRIKTSKLIPIKSFIMVASSAESELLNEGIKAKQAEIDHLKHCVSLSDISVLLDPIAKEIRNIQSALDKKLAWLIRQDETLWVAWPSKESDDGVVQKSEKKCSQASSTTLSNKKKKNAFKKEKRAKNRILRLSQMALESKSVINLSKTPIPPEAIVVLAKRIGFAPTATFNHLQTKIDASATMAKLCSNTRFLMKSIDPDISTSLEPEIDDIHADLPSNLRLPHLSTPASSNDPLIDAVCEDLLSYIEHFKPVSLKSNVTYLERIGLKWILEEVKKGDLQFVRADKGGALCIMERSFMRELELKKLQDISQFECLGKEDPIPAVTNNLLDLWRSGEASGFVDRDISYKVVGLCDSGRPSTLSLFKPGIPYFYGLLKIHKLNDAQLTPGTHIPLRLVNDLSKSPTVRSDKFINWKFLQPLQAEFCKDLVKDSTETLRWLEDVGKLSLTNLNSFSWDFSALYDNLSPEFVMEALSFAISELRPDWSDDFIEWLLDLVSLSLDSCFGRHGDLWYRNKSGIATGGSLSVSLANIAVYYALRCAIFDSDNAPDQLLGLKRFVDDLTGLWVGSRSEFIIWADRINSNLNRLGLSIKDDINEPWDFHEVGDYTTFLDIKFMFDDSGSLFTDINVKSTDARVYLHYSSYHPRQIFPSIVYSQALRYKRIINDNIRLFRRLDDLKCCFLNSGYPKKLVENILEDVIKRPRNLDYKNQVKKPPNKVMWIQTFGPATDKIKQLVKEANLVVQKSPAWANISKALGVVSRKASNLGDLILKRKKFALSNFGIPVGTERCTPLIQPQRKSRRGRPCESCPLMSNFNVVKSTVTGRSYEVPNGNCKSRNVVYCAECFLCNKQYTGKSTTKLQTRISGHRSHVGDMTFDSETDEATLAEHLHDEHNITLVDQFNSNYSFTIIEISPRNLDIAEQKWTNRLVTMRPFGLNKEKPGGVMGSISYMSRKSLDSKLQCL